MSEANREFWDNHAKRDPLWAILSDPSKTGRRWDLADFMATGRREISLLMYQLRALSITTDRRAALDFGCGVGRLSQPLADYFDKVVGVDISPQMIQLANQINQHPGTIRYVCNGRSDLAVFASGEFTFMYSNVVLQHLEPDTALGFLRELLRVVAPGGTLVFQLPSHPRPPEEQKTVQPMPAEAYRVSIQVESELPTDVRPGAEVVVVVSVTNASDHQWVQQDSGAIRLGNHWLTASGDQMLVQDDGRADLPNRLMPGETCRVTLQVTVPAAAGDYQLECDLVHEAVSWFADRGSKTWRGRVTSAGDEDQQAPPITGASTSAVPALVLSNDGVVPEAGELPMHGVHSDVVEALVREHGGRVVHREIDERSGPEWVGYRYFVQKL